MRLRGLKFQEVTILLLTCGKYQVGVIVILILVLNWGGGGMSTFGVEQII